MSDTAVILLNLGGPATLDEVRPFLLTLFQDREIIRLGPAWFQPLLARLIVHSRLKKAKERYARIGGGSPLLQETLAQARALSRALAQAGKPMEIHPVFRYSAPRAAETLERLKERGIRRILPVSLYPHACRATIGSSLSELSREAKRLGLELLQGVRSYATDPGYLDAMETLIRTSLAWAKRAAVVFSAHSLPLRQIKEGDPYEREIKATTQALQERIGPIPGGYRLAYQSQIGVVGWLEPSLRETLSSLRDQEVVIVPISFVSEHVETLLELDIEYREWASQCGIRSYHRVPTLGVDAKYIQALTRLVLETAP